MKEILKKIMRILFFYESYKHNGKTHKKESNKNEKNQEIYLCQKNCLWWLKLGHYFILPQRY